MGAVMLAYGVLAALLARERYGVGQEVDALAPRLHDRSSRASRVSSRLMTGVALPRSFRARAINPLWNHYRCADDKWIALAMLQPDRYWADFARAIGRPELATDARFATLRARAGNAAELRRDPRRGLRAASRAPSGSSILRDGGDFIFTIVNSVDDLPDDPQVQRERLRRRRSTTRSTARRRCVGIPVRLSETPGSVRAPAPELGQHTEEILTDAARLGLGPDQRAAREAGHLRLRRSAARRSRLATASGGGSDTGTSPRPRIAVGRSAPKGSS